MEEWIKPLGAAIPFAGLALFVIRYLMQQVAAKDAQIVEQNKQLLAAFTAGTAALTEVKAELRSQQ